MLANGRVTVARRSVPPMSWRNRGNRGTRGKGPGNSRKTLRFTPLFST
jgi:hypothetical protein